MYEQTRAARADQIRSMYDDGLCSRETALRELGRLLDLSDGDAVEMLDHPIVPSVRIAGVQEWRP